MSVMCLKMKLTTRLWVLIRGCKDWPCSLKSHFVSFPAGLDDTWLGRAGINANMKFEEICLFVLRIGIRQKSTRSRRFSLQDKVCVLRYEEVLERHR